MRSYLSTGWRVYDIYLGVHKHNSRRLNCTVNSCAGALCAAAAVALAAAFVEDVAAEVEFIGGHADAGVVCWDGGGQGGGDEGEEASEL
ncbi:hypothetical protein TWF103_002186 [Orbilia oligospora]|nr:hypothetical protein TWF103_002186 [Orbilia oligospora]